MSRLGRVGPLEWAHALIIGAAIIGWLATPSTAISSSGGGVVPDGTKNWSRLYLHHIPKCAGTKARQALYTLVRQQGLQPCEQVLSAKHYACFGSEETAATIAWFRDDFGTGNCSFASTHYDFSLLDALSPEALNRTLVVAVLRNPVARVLSDWHWQHWMVDEKHLVTDTPPPRSLLTFARARHSPGFPGHGGCGIMVDHMAGTFDWCNPLAIAAATRQEALARALANLQRVDVVLLQEHLVDGLQYLEALTNASLSRGGFRFSTAVNVRDDPAVKVPQELTALCADDMLLYQAALQRHKQQEQWLDKLTVT